jgi:ABC-type antimicrobial peptide transport system permease subunit
MPLPYHYIFRNLLTRKLTTALTAGGMALVVYVFATVLMLEAGLKQTLVATGSDENVTVIRQSSQTEVQSSIERNQASIVESSPEIAYLQDGRKAISKEVMVLVTLPKKAGGAPSNVAIRGSSDIGVAIRPQIRLSQGRLFRAGSSEIVVGRSITERFSNAGLGQTLHFGQRDWTIVGIVDAGRTGFNSEIWGDAEQMMQAFRRPVYSAITFRLSDSERFEVLQQAIGNDQRLTLEAKRETQFYADQSEMMAKFIKYLGMALSVIFSLGAIIGAMITMYASVSNRVGEIGTLRALGFQRRTVLAAFLLESLLLSSIGGLIGLLAASSMQWLTISTMNWQTFSELAFSFTLTPGIVLNSLLFALLMGLIGGVLPSLRAARLNIVDALRAG